MSGRIFLFGDNIDTDQLAPGFYMRGGIGQLAGHCLEGVRPDFAKTVKPGDVLVAGKNFGVGSSREQAAEALKYLGVAGVVAYSFAGIFHRNAINLGLPVLTSTELAEVADGDAAVLDHNSATLRLTEKQKIVALDPLADHLKVLLQDGGLVPHLKKRFSGTHHETETL